MDAIEIKLKDIAVARGAPTKPRATGSGPQTRVLKVSCDQDEGSHFTENVVEDCIDWRNDEDDLGWNREKTLGLEIAT